MGINFKDLPDHVKKRIQQDPANHRALAGLRSKESKQDQRCEVKAGQLESGEECRGFRIQFICLRRRLLDQHDNLPASCKAAADRISERLGFRNADNDPRLIWDYSQLKTKGKQGTIVTIEPL